MKQGIIPFNRINPAQLVIDLLPAIMVSELIFKFFAGQETADPDCQIRIAIMLVLLLIYT